MARMRFHLDRRGIRQVLNSAPVRALVNEAAQDVASRTRAASGMDVVVDGGTTDRAVARVVVKDGKARAAQARSGILTRSATAAGLEVRG